MKKALSLRLHLGGLAITGGAEVNLRVSSLTRELGDESQDYDVDAGVLAHAG